MENQRRKTDSLIMLYSFTGPALTVLLSFAFKELAPFGGRSIISMDGFSQYYPMLENMADALKNGELFYSFNGFIHFTFSEIFLHTLKVFCLGLEGAHLF